MGRGPQQLNKTAWAEAHPTPSPRPSPGGRGELGAMNRAPATFQRHCGKEKCGGGENTVSGAESCSRKPLLARRTLRERFATAGQASSAALFQQPGVPSSFFSCAPQEGRAPAPSPVPSPGGRGELGAMNRAPAVFRRHCGKEGCAFSSLTASSQCGRPRRVPPSCRVSEQIQASRHQLFPGPCR